MEDGGGLRTIVGILGVNNADVAWVAGTGRGGG